MRNAAFLAACLAFFVSAGAPSARAVDAASTTSAHDFAFVSIDGEPMPLTAFEGQPILLVNTASRCGFTQQYEGLQTVWEAYRDRGLVVLGAPSDDFRQELADEAAVKHFCEVNFSIDFPMTEIVDVKGPDAHPFYAWAADVEGAPRWNFYKYLIDGDGAIVGFYPSSTRPTDARLTKAIEALLPR